MPRPAVLTYDGTRLHSNGPHTIRSKSFVAVGDALERFRLRCTDQPAPTLIRIDLANSAAASEEYKTRVRARCIAEFGAPAADFGRREGGMDNWFLAQSQWKSALRLLDDVAPIPATHDGFGVLNLSYKLEFKFRRASSEELLPFQSREDYLNCEADYERYLGWSTLTVDLSTRTVFSAFFSLPFEEWDTEAQDHVRFIQTELPFRISEKRWKRWSLTKSGRTYVGRKIHVSW